MKLTQKDFSSITEYEGYLEAGKTYGNPAVYTPGSNFAKRFKLGWDKRKQEIDSLDAILNANANRL